MRKPAVIYTVGHSTRSLDDFVALLHSFGIGQLVDIRTIPRSRHNPQFNSDTLREFLRDHHIVYRHMKGLGGLRHARADSRNCGWRNASFRGFADYMQTPEFEAAIEELIECATEEPTAIMCAESVPWRCHRSLIGDALLIRGIEVMDIFSSTGARPHLVSPMAVVHGTEITYPISEEDGAL